MKNVWLEHPLLDGAAAVVLAGGHLAVSTRTRRFDLLGQMRFSDRLSVYTDLITVTGIFVGFSLTALAAYLALSGPNIDRLREAAHAKVLKQWISAIIGTSCVLISVLVCKIADREQHAFYVHWIVWVSLIFLLFRASRMIYVFSQLTGIAIAGPFERRRRTRGIGVRGA